MKLDVVGFGALNMDTLYRVNRIAHEDEESYITGSTESCGGSAANTIVGLSRLGLKTGFIGKVATDREGSLLHNNLQNENINTDCVTVSSNGKSGTVRGFVDNEGQRALYVDPGVNDCLEEDEVDIEWINNSKVLHITSFVGKYHENSIKTQETVLKEISDSVCLSFDPGRLYTERGMDFMYKFLTRTNILLINRLELEQLTGKPANTLAGNTQTVEAAAHIKSEYGIDIVVVKMGSEGSYVTSKCESHFTDAFDVLCVDTTGAGDAFNAGFLHGYVQGENIKTSALKGNYIASCCVTEHGATDGLTDLAVVNDIRKNLVG
ncbi:MAG TPA: carbohydrate kinase family protein [Methanobacterium sp.]|nr:carbohydrate kinase family protein [Methanobacterium sp.]